MRTNLTLTPQPLDLSGTQERGKSVKKTLNSFIQHQQKTARHKHRTPLHPKYIATLTYYVIPWSLNFLICAC